MSEQEVEVQDDSINPDDKTSKNELQEEVDKLPDEDADEELDKGKEPEDKKKDDVDRSEVVQKARWREKFRREREARIAAEEKLRGKENPKKSGEGDDKEEAARQYIRNEARKTFEELEAERKQKEERELEDFEDQVDEVLEDNPSIKESDLLEIIEEYDVDPQSAVKILKRLDEAKTAIQKEKPKMPAPKRASASPAKEKIDDSKKSWHEIARDAAKKLISKE